MNIENELLKLAVAQEAYDNNHPVSYYQNTYHKFEEFYTQKLQSSPFRKSNAEKIIKHLDIILKYTGAYSENWITYRSLYSQDNFLDILSENLKYFQFPNHIHDLFANLYNTISNDEESVINKEDIFNEKMLISILDLKINSNAYSKIYRMMTREQRKK